MKKALIATSSLLLAGVFLAPGIVGIKAKERMDTLIEQLNSVPNYHATWESYDRGWFSAEGVMNLEMEIPIEPGQSPVQLAFQAQMDVDHGPVIINNGLQLAWASWSSAVSTPEAWEQWINLGERPLFTQTGHVSLTGDYVMQDDMPGFTLTTEEGTVKVSGFQGSGTIHSEQLVYQGSLPEITFESPLLPEPLTLSALGITMDTVLPEQGLALGALLPGDFSMTLASAAMGNTFLMDNLTISSGVTLNDDDTLADIAVRYAVERVEAPELKLFDAGMDITLANYSTEFNRKYTDLMQGPLLDSESEQEAQALLLDFVEHNLESLLAGKPELNIENVRFSLPEGSFSSHMNVKLADYNIEPDSLANPLFLQNNLVMDAYADADKQLALKLASVAATTTLDSDPSTRGINAVEKQAMIQQQAEMMVGMLTAGGMLVPKEDKLTAELTVENGQTTINGRPMP